MLAARWLTGGAMASTTLDDLGRWLDRGQVDLDDLLRACLDRIKTAAEADRATLYLIDDARQELVSRVAHLPEIAEIRLKIGEGIAGRVARTGKVIRVPGDVDPEGIAVRVDAQTGYVTATVIAAPVRGHDGRVLGVVQVLNKPRGFSEADADTLERVADQLGAILERTSLAPMIGPGQRHPLAFRFNEVIGDSPSMRAVYDRLGRAAPTQATVLLRGETGTGKELMARAVHVNSPRRDGPFVKVDCGALPASLIENELFGHRRGAFTGADRDAPGMIAAAEGGTLFLDEVAELPPAAQVKVLRLLQDRTYVPVGDTQPRAADVRFVAATHRDLERAVAEGALRQDLYYRLRVVEVVLPPLRARGAADLDRLTDHFLFVYGRKHGRPDLELTEAARATLHGHPWAGNVRELEHLIESAVVLAPEARIEPDDLALGPTVGAAPIGARFCTDLRPLREVEAAYVAHVLAHHDGNRTAAARDLEIGRNTLLRKLRAGDPEG